MRNLLLAHWRMRADGGKNSLELVAVMLVDNAGNLARTRMLAALIGRYGKNVAARAKLRQAFNDQLIQLLRTEIGIDASLGAIKAHAKSP